MRPYIQILKTYDYQTVPSVLVVFENKRYIFNINEGLQRFLRQKYNLANKKSIYHDLLKYFSASLKIVICRVLLVFYSLFLSRKIRSGVKFLEILICLISCIILSKYLRSRFMVGHKILSYSFFDFINKRCMKGITQEKDLEKVFLDPSKLYKDDFVQSCKDINNCEDFINENGNFQDDNMEIIPIVIQQQILQFICKTKKLPPKIDKEEVDKLNIPKNLKPQFFKGQPIELGGKTLNVLDFQLPQDPAPIFFILECPDEKSLDELIQIPIFQQFSHEQLNEQDNYISHIIFNADPDILRIQKFQQWLNQFKAQIIFTRQSTQQAYQGELQTNLFKHLVSNQILHQYFPIYFPNIKIQQNEISYMEYQQIYLKQLKSLFHFDLDLQFAKKYYQYDIHPQKKITNNYFSNDNIFEVGQEYLNRFQNLRKFHQIQNTKIQNLLDNNFDPQLIFLGTGSQMPAAYRNVSCILIRSPKLTIMMDCGEGSSNQFYNHFSSKYMQELQNLKIIFITHIHGDHHLGLFSMIKDRQQFFKDPVYVIIPFNMASWLQIYDQHIDSLNIITIFSQSLSKDGQLDINNFFDNSMSKNPKNNDVQKEYLYMDPNLHNFVKLQMQKSDENLNNFQTFLNQFDIDTFLPIPVDHCPQSYGILIKYSNNFRIVYTGDCVPSPEMLEYETDILIHEATYDDDLQSQALQNMHSTISDAIIMAKSMKAWRLFLTHFSQRYQCLDFQEKDSLKDQDPEKYDYLKNNTVIALDHLQSHLSEMELLPEYSHCMSIILPERDRDKSEKQSNSEQQTSSKKKKL